MERRLKRSRTVALLGAALVALIMSALVVALTDRPFWRVAGPQGKALRAAVAIRDNVVPYQKWGTKALTRPYLARYYGRSCYFTEDSRGDRKREFQQCLAQVLAAHEAVDIFLLAHSNDYVAWVEELDRSLTAKIRLVYNTGCRDASQADRWLGLGARTYIGHPGKSESPPFYFYFLRRWTAGWAAGEAAEDANSRAHRAFVRAEFLSGGRLDAQRIWRGTRALCFGDAGTTIGG